MREFYETRFFVDSLQSGIIQDHRVQVNKPGLLGVLNMKPVPGLGLCAQEELSRLFPDQEITWPFPQIFRGSEETILAFETALYQINESDWSLTPLIVYDAYDLETCPAIPAGGSWHFVDHGVSWMLLNGQCVIHKQRRYGIFGQTDKIILYQDVRAETGCSFIGRTLLAGFSPNHFWNNAWQGVWSEWELWMPGGLSASGRDLGQNYVLWSTIGGDLLWLIYPDFARKGFVSEDDATGYDYQDSNFESKLFFNMLKRNELGWMPMPFQDKIIKIAPLGEKGVIVYSPTGVVLMYPDSRVFPTFGKKQIATFGPTNRGAISVGKDDHVFLDKNGRVWRVTAEGIEQVANNRLYGSFLIDNLASSYDSLNDEHYISSEDVCIVITKAGVGEVSDRPTSGLVTSNGFSIISEPRTQLGKVIVFNTMDFNMPGSEKKIENVEISANDTRKLFVSTYYRYKRSEHFRLLPWIQVSDSGSAYLGIVGLEFRLAIKSMSEDLKISSVSARWKSTDKRIIKGLYAASSESS
uniref:Uncharacterized protein n=1 Tax=viral metagenome TaxID=1070528 RepID=A0A6M3KQE3_9ZZZZ